MSDRIENHLQRLIEEENLPEHDLHGRAFNRALAEHS